jgi:hypothetical protein
VRQKAIVVAAVKGGLLSIDEASGRYALTVEEYLSWQDAVERHGLAGLRTTKIQRYRGYRRATIRQKLRRPGSKRRELRHLHQLMSAIQKI